jgi:hypothetical protein
MMGLGPHLHPILGQRESSSTMRRGRAVTFSLDPPDGRIADNAGTVLFYAMSGMFFCLFTFALWYCPRHL